LLKLIINVCLTLTGPIII